MHHAGAAQAGAAAELGAGELELLADDPKKRRRCRRIRIRRRAVDLELRSQTWPPPLSRLAMQAVSTRRHRRAPDRHTCNQSRIMRPETGAVTPAISTGCRCRGPRTRDE